MLQYLTAILRKSHVAALALVATVLLAACGGGNSQESTSRPKCNDLGTITPGIITVSIQSYMPYIGPDDSGKLTGLDGDILTNAANNLGCGLSVSVTDFAGTLAAVQSRRADMTLGSVGWSSQRAQSGLFTDPPYYSPVAIIEAKGSHLTTLAQLEGKVVGGLTGGFLSTTGALKAIPGATEKLYSTNAATIDDVVAGRLDAYFTDPLIAAYAVKTNPSLNIEVDYLTPPTDAELAAHPLYKHFQPYMTGFYIANSAAGLEEALTKHILGFYEDGTLSRLLSKWGAEPTSYLTPLPQFTTERVGMDRPQGWQAPSAR